MGRGSESTHDGEDVVLEHQLTDDRRRVRRVVHVVDVLELDLPTIDSAFRVHVLIQRVLRRSDLAISRGRDTGERLVAADQDGIGGHSRSLCGLDRGRRYAARDQNERDRRNQHHDGPRAPLVGPEVLGHGSLFHFHWPPSPTPATQLSTRPSSLLPANPVGARSFSRPVCVRTQRARLLTPPWMPPGNTNMTTMRARP